MNKAASFLKDSSPAIFAYIFGSFLEDEAFNDIDIALFLGNGSGRDILELEREMEALMETEVEICRLDTAPLSFTFRVIKEGELIFSRDERRRCDFEERTRVLYFDFLPYYQRYYKEVVLGQR
ncbi:MAG: nucleotidyltransferase domain-containing protein [Actinomycetota bacterium]|nr:nucleotidyltransferase domain-containing protein [Actinomycetota bacterium]